MKLVELGNTRWKLADFSAQQFRFLGHGQGLDDLMLVLSQESQTPVLFASVASEELNAQLQQRLTQAQLRFMQVNTQRSFGNLVNCYHHYQRLGVDRWLALIAAHHMHKGYSAIVDVGTAVTFDLLHKDGRHLGGWIAPGLHTMQDALTARSSRIRSRDTAPSMELGQCTEDGLFLGCRAAVTGFIEQANEYVKREIGEPVRWLFTGGGMEYLHITTVHNAELHPHLVLEGLGEVARQLD